MITETRVCLSCQRHFHGRSDKKFCNDYCRNAHHNRLNSDHNHYIRNINHCLRKNRRILEDVVKTGREMARVSKESLLIKGFNFYFHTHCFTNKKGSPLYCCYDYGYRLYGDGSVMVIKKLSEKSPVSFAEMPLSI